MSSSSTSSSEPDRRLIESAREQLEEAEARISAKPACIGEYQIHSILGHGGMGVVYRAEQPHTRRVVALKVLRTGLVGVEMLRRFEKEAQVLGRLHHIGIAHIYEGGMEQGQLGYRPYFAMELVEGLPLTDHCEANQLDTSGRLELLAKVCDAVEHAHQNNVIHRDLKPSNILVDGTGQPKVLDFGVARVTDVGVAAATLRTEARKLIGTLPYMSPEQISGDPGLVDARSDIYAIGVLGYRMLTGRYPFNISGSSIPEAVRAIQEDDPIRPSRINRMCRGDVETIILKALEKDPRRRYQACVDLASDIRRHLNDEPIRARPPGRIYRLRKFVRRNRALTTTVSTIICVLLIGLFASTWGLRLYERRLEQLRMLATGAKLDVLRDAAANLGGPFPQNVAEMRKWLNSAWPLKAQHQVCRDELRTLHERSMNFNLKRDFDRRVLRHVVELSELREELARERLRLDQRLAATGMTADRDEVVVRLRNRISELEGQEADLARLISQGHVCEFQDDADRLQHDALIQIEQNLQDFFDPITGIYAIVDQRCGFASKVKLNTILKYREAWREALRSILDPAASPAYREVARDPGAETWIVPQLGLVPVGRDPDSGLWEFCHVLSGEIPTRGADGKLLLTRQTGLIVVLLPGGAVHLGAQRGPPRSADGDEQWDPLALRDESPVKPVTLSPFFISKYEMTADQWMRLTHTVYRPHDIQPSPSPYPAATISWQDCDRELTFAGLTLPTEAQWEYAARAGTHDPWWTGPEPGSLSGAANINDEAIAKDGFMGAVAPIGRLRANAFGLHDVIGNVSEWCLDALGDYDMPVSPGDGRRMSGLGDAGRRVIRGGNFRDSAIRARVSARQGSLPDYRKDDAGVRPVLILQSEASTSAKDAKK